jgi:hypothetical protein
MPTKDELAEIYRQLSAPFPAEAIERTTAEQTGRGYDTSGIKIAYVIDRLNRVLGIGGFRFSPRVEVRERAARNGRQVYEAVCELVLQLGKWDQGHFVPFAEASGFGGHIAVLEADARKGALSNALKKTASIVGCGWQAFAGRLDDDNEPDAFAELENDERWADRKHGAKKQHLETANNTRAEGEAAQARPGRSRTNGASKNSSSTKTGRRVTNAQLAKLRELVEEIGKEWTAFRNEVRDRHGVNLEYTSTALASELITELVSQARRNRANVHAKEASGDSR